LVLWLGGGLVRARYAERLPAGHVVLTAREQSRMPPLRPCMG